MLVSIFCEIDDFCKDLEKISGMKLPGNNNAIRRRRALTLMPVRKLVYT